MITQDMFLDLVKSTWWILPLITGLIMVLRTAFPVDKRWLPLWSVIFGILLGGLVLGWTVLALLVGLALGLASTGLWEFGKHTVAGKK